jgi:predicted kinase
VIVLIGFMGAGKSTVGREVASRLGLPFVDSDSVIEERERRSVAEIFAHDGEPAFRSVERRTVLDLLAGPPAVLALGGGAVEDPVTRAEVARATTVHLVVSAEQVTCAWAAIRFGRAGAADPGRCSSAGCRTTTRRPASGCSPTGGAWQPWSTTSSLAYESVGRERATSGS